MAVSNGQHRPNAFWAVVYFRDDADRLIFPPYAGFDDIAPGLSGFAVAGGESDAPAATSHAFRAPKGAASLEIELRANAHAARPRVSHPPMLVAGDKAARSAGTICTAPVIGQAIDAQTRMISISLLNGNSGGRTAFLAQPVYYDAKGAVLLGPYAGFARSNQFGSYVYLPGGSAERPARKTIALDPPKGAAWLDLVIHPRSYQGKAALAGLPLAGAPAAWDDRASAPPADQLVHAVAQPSMGARIRAKLGRQKPGVIGIYGAEIAARLGDRALLSDLPYDGYDQLWQKLAAGHLLIEAAELGHRSGWQNALGLDDPSTTVELAVMLERARAEGMRTVLVLPAQEQRYPLLSRVAGLFDKIHRPRDGEFTLDPAT